MIDTVAVQYRIEIPKQFLSLWDESTTRKANGKYQITRRLKAPLRNEATATCSHYPYSFDRKPLLQVELSLPHVVYGNNYTMLWDLEQGVKIANDALSQVPGIPSVDLWEGVIARLDICYNHQVGDLVPYYVAALQHLEYSRRKTMPYASEGVQYKNNKATTKFYDKEKECEDPATHGILRQETTLRKDKVQKLTGKKKPTLRDISTDMLFDFLETELQQLEILGRSIGTCDTALKTLCNKHGELAGVYFYGWHCARVSLPSKKTLAKVTKCHPRTLERRLQKIVDAEVPLTLTEHKKPLPALKIDRTIAKNGGG